MVEFFIRNLEGGYSAIMIDGMCFGKMTIVIVMRIREEGTKQILILSYVILYIKETTSTIDKKS
jgi:hypothetical protein